MTGRDEENPSVVDPDAQARTDLPPAARRALAEAEERRKAREAGHVPRPTEVDGRSGPEPTRYGDWEKGGIVSDF